MVLRHANNADFGAAIAALRKRIVAGIASDDFGIELQKIIALGIDGHSGVSGYRLPPGGCLPFLIETTGPRYVAFTPDRRAYLAEGFPFLFTPLLIRLLHAAKIGFSMENTSETSKPIDSTKTNNQRTRNWLEEAVQEYLTYIEKFYTPYWNSRTELAKSIISPASASIVLTVTA